MIFGENKQRLAQWKLKSDWAKGFFEQNPIGRVISSLARSRLPWFLRETAREAGLMKGNENTLKPVHHKLHCEGANIIADILLNRHTVSKRDCRICGHL